MLREPNATIGRKLMLVFVAYHPSFEEVRQLQKCLNNLSIEIGYSVVVNDYINGEPVSSLLSNADYYLINKSNLGYGRAVNRLVQLFKDDPQFIGVLNTDLFWQDQTFESLLEWIDKNDDVVLSTPQILDNTGEIQHLCKRNPTLLALLSRRFVPGCIKPNWLKTYDSWFQMGDHDYSQIFEATYLSGCCMIIRFNAFLSIGGFDERFFLYLEDADLTRRLSAVGRCVHLPIVSVFHAWGKGSYKNIRLMLVNIYSAYLYFRIWGFALW